MIIIESDISDIQITALAIGDRCHMQKVIQNHDNNILIIVGAALSLIALGFAILPINEVNAKQCSDSGSLDTNDQNNNSNDDRSCTNQQNSNNHVYSNTKDATPFVLPAPFP